jgi:hypothetical protein
MTTTQEFHAAIVLMTMRDDMRCGNLFGTLLTNVSTVASRSSTVASRSSTVASRSPTTNEINKGIPRDFFVKETFRSGGRVDREYFSPTGQRFRSMVQVRTSKGTI